MTGRGGGSELCHHTPGRRITRGARHSGVSRLRGECRRGCLDLVAVTGRGRDRPGLLISAVEQPDASQGRLHAVRVERSCGPAPAQCLERRRSNSSCTGQHPAASPLVAQQHAISTPGAAMNPIDMTATQLVAAYTAQELSPVEVTTAVLDRIQDIDESLNAYCFLDRATTLEQARASESRWHTGHPQGLLDGVPVSIKDIFLTQSWPTLRGSLTVDPDQPWTEDSPVAAKLRADGMVFTGKTTTPELAWKAVTDSPLSGITCNPIDPRLTAGGSSGGAAAAVAAGMGPCAVGTDGGGSIRIPAAFCGIVGFKPTHGRIPMFPASPFGPLAHAGPMTRTVEDAVLLMDILSVPD